MAPSTWDQNDQDSTLVVGVVGFGRMESNLPSPTPTPKKPYTALCVRTSITLSFPSPKTGLCQDFGFLKIVKPVLRFYLVGTVIPIRYFSILV